MPLSRRPLIILDLDGPLLDVREKYSRVYTDLLINAGHESLPAAEYWAEKRRRTPERAILAMTGAEAFHEVYQPRRNHLIETAPYLALDKLQPSVLGALRALKSMGAELAVCTMRREEDGLRSQLRLFGLEPLLEKVLFAGQRNHCWETKAALVKEHYGDLSGRPSIFIGDTETDIRAGKSLGCFTVAVTCGIREESILADEKPSALATGFSSILQLASSSLNMPSISAAL